MKKVYMCLSTDIIHTGHINIIKKAAEYGEVTVGVLSDEYVALYETSPIISLTERMKIIENIRGVSHVIVQNDIFYDENLKKVRPDYIIHGDNWNQGYQKEVKERAARVMAEWGGEIIEIPYYENEGLSLFNSYLKRNAGAAETKAETAVK